MPNYYIAILYKYWLHERVTWEIVTLIKPMSTEAKPRLTLVFEGWHWFSRGDNFPRYPLVQSIFIILYWMWIKYIVYITLGIKTIPVEWIFVFVSRTPFIQTLIRRQSESMVNPTCINSAQSIFFLEYHPSSSNITRCQILSRVRAWFHDSAGEIDF